ncbi:hypothetical protein ABIA25_000191 [Sinorhizobium fredii]|nr:hypothetical protein EFR01_53190 [Sinorhizobium fredii]GLS06833.1 hypothetical protein GCM10007864_04580 [Sinorhizobium fredii]
MPRRPNVNNDIIAFDEQSRRMVGQLQGSGRAAVLSCERFHDRGYIEPSKPVWCGDPEVSANRTPAIS